MRTMIQMTYEEESPGVPLWGINALITEVPVDKDEIAIENLVAGRTYYVKTWNEDQFGNKSQEIVRTIKTATPTRVSPMSFSAQGVLDDGSAMYGFIKVPSSAKRVTECFVTLAFREFFASAKTAATSGSLTSDSGGGSTSGASSATSSNEENVHYHGFALIGAAIGAPTTKRYAGTAGALGTDFNLPVSDGTKNVYTNVNASHAHDIPHTHTTPNHTHTVPGHTHSLTYGTFEEAYPASHSVTVTVQQRVAQTWTTVHTITGLTGDIVDLDLSSVVVSRGDWRITVKSEAGQPNSGRLGCDLFGSLSVVI